MTSGQPEIFTIVIALLVAIVYFTPSLLAYKKKRNAKAILALNIFAGWTFVGWIIALVWALTKDRD